jgi:glycosyltransferase involved in cell wall biosynthesis
MACEVPVVATSVGGLPEVVRDQIDGYLCAVGDVASMADGCLRILGDSGLAAQMGRSARERARKEFCSSKIVVQYEDLYRRTIQQSHSG